MVIGLGAGGRTVNERLAWKCVYASVAEPGPGRYYTREADTVADQLAEWVGSRGIQEVCFTGVSKAGYGSLLWSILLARRLPDVTVSALVMAPQVRLWPMNEGIKKPSYLGMIRDATNGSAGSDALLSALDKFGTLPDPSLLPNYFARVVYPARYVPDANEAQRIEWENAELIGLPISIHNVVLPYLWDVSNAQTVRTAVGRLIEAGKRDADIASYMTHSDPEDLVTEYRALAPHPMLVDAIEDLMITARDRIA